MTEVALMPQDPDAQISADLAPGVESGNFAITNVRQLQWAAKMAAESRLFGAITKEQAGIIMWKSLRLSVDPFVGLEHIHVINGKPRPDGLLVAFLIKRSPLVKRNTWKPKRSKTECSISVELRDGTVINQTVKIEEIDQSDRNKDNWKKYPERMLYWRCVAMMGQTYFEDQMLGMLPMVDEHATIIDVEAVQAEAGTDLSNEECPKCHRFGTLSLLPNRKGGAFTTCRACGEASAPPQTIRDTLRGRTHEFVPRPVDAPDATFFDVTPDEPVDAAAKGDTLDGEDVAPSVAVHVSEAPPIPERDGPVSNLQMRSAIYEHWVRPRPTHIKIEMRVLLEEFGWTSGDTLGDWLLGLPDDKLAAIGDALAAYR